MFSDKVLIEECRKHNRLAQRELYEKYAPKMRAIANRYSNGSDDAKDILQDAFIKVYTKIAQFSGSGSFEGWIKRIVVNTAIEHFHKNSRTSFSSIENISNDHFNPEQNQENNQEIDKKDFDEHFSFDLVLQAGFTKDELLKAVNELSENFRLAFNLFFIESYSHKEIAELMKIDETTSRTRVARSKKQLQEKLYKLTQEKLCR